LIFFFFFADKNGERSPLGFFLKIISFVSRLSPQSMTVVDLFAKGPMRVPKAPGHGGAQRAHAAGAGWGAIAWMRAPKRAQRRGRGSRAPAPAGSSSADWRAGDAAVAATAHDAAGDPAVTADPLAQPSPPLTDTDPTLSGPTQASPGLDDDVLIVTGADGALYTWQSASERALAGDRAEVERVRTRDGHSRAVFGVWPRPIASAAERHTSTPVTQEAISVSLDRRTVLWSTADPGGSSRAAASLPQPAGSAATPPSSSSSAGPGSIVTPVAALTGFGGFAYAVAPCPLAPSRVAVAVGDSTIRIADQDDLLVDQETEDGGRFAHGYLGLSFFFFFFFSFFFSFSFLLDCNILTIPRCPW
jgi:hypothetical protein